MSMSYWMIEGIGIDVDKIRPYLNKRKVLNLVLKHYPDDELALEWKCRRDLSGLDIDEFIHGNPFDTLGDLLTHCDDTDCLTFGNYGDGGVYIYYPPSMPWHRTENEPNSQEEVHRRLIDAVLKVADMDAAAIGKLIDDDIYEVGWG